jgi:hypothetical protein
LFAAVIATVQVVPFDDVQPVQFVKLEPVAGIAVSVSFEPHNAGRIYGDAWQRRNARGIGICTTADRFCGGVCEAARIWPELRHLRNDAIYYKCSSGARRLPCFLQIASSKRNFLSFEPVCADTLHAHRI